VLFYLASIPYIKIIYFPISQEVNQDSLQKELEYRS
jgi:hypothetical protein